MPMPPSLFLSLNLSNQTTIICFAFNLSNETIIIALLSHIENSDTWADSRQLCVQKPETENVWEFSISDPKKY